MSLSQNVFSIEWVLQDTLGSLRECTCKMYTPFLYLVSKETYLVSKEIYLVSKEIYLVSKETYLVSKETY
jgi:hypothetical protein